MDVSLLLFYDILDVFECHLVVVVFFYGIVRKRAERSPDGKLMDTGNTREISNAVRFLEVSAKFLGI